MTKIVPEILLLCCVVESCGHCLSSVPLSIGSVAISSLIKVDSLLVDKKKSRVFLRSRLTRFFSHITSKNLSRLEY